MADHPFRAKATRLKEGVPDRAALRFWENCGPVAGAGQNAGAAGVCLALARETRYAIKNLMLQRHRRL